MDDSDFGHFSKEINLIYDVRVKVDFSDFGKTVSILFEVLLIKFELIFNEHIF